MQKFLTVAVSIILISLDMQASDEGAGRKVAAESPIDAPGAVEKKDGVDLWHRSTLTGNWNDTRDMFGEKGISFSLGYKGDNASNLSGGLERSSSYLHNIDLLIGLDAEKLLNWKGASLLVQAISNNGGGLCNQIGVAQCISNIDGPKTTKLYQAWLQQKALGGKMSFLAGLYDLNSEFYVTSASSVFLNTSFSIGKEFSQTGRNGPSIFPNSSMAFRIRMLPTKVWSFQFAILDAVPGRPDDSPLKPSLFMSAEEGALAIGEVSYHWGGLDERNIGGGKYTLGAWLYTAAFAETQAIALSGEALRSTSNNGWYMMAEQRVYAERSDDLQGLYVFSRLGFANGSINQFAYDWSFGLTYTGPLSGREEDQIGFAVTQANSSTFYTKAKHLAGEPLASAEMVLECTYKARLTPWLAIQPDLQRIIHPGTNLGIDDATVVGSRLEVGF